jgi:hypothetical protein
VAQPRVVSLGGADLPTRRCHPALPPGAATRPSGGCAGSGARLGAVGRERSYGDAVEEPPMNKTAEAAPERGGAVTRLGAWGLADERQHEQPASGGPVVPALG